MAISRVKTWGNEVLTPADLNAEFNNIINNPMSYISPLTSDLAAGGNKFTGLSLGTAASPTLQFTGDTDTGIYSSGADAVDIAAGGNQVARFSTQLTANAPLIASTNREVKTVALTNGKILIGSTGADPIAAFITAGTGIAETVGAGSLTLLTDVNEKTADETVNNSTVLQDDDTTRFFMAASTSYFLEVFLLLNAANTTGDYKFGWTLPVGATMFWGPINTGAGAEYWSGIGTASTPATLLTAADTLAVGSKGATSGLILYAIVINSVTTGNAQLQWAQNTADVSNTKILMHSFLRATKIQ